ncbi:hypothetical protein BGZ65_010760, partial [Modicella reniformis]
MWILDIPSLIWTKTYGYKEKRCMHACTIIQDTFISWGGYDGSNTADGSILLFDIPTQTYLTAYSTSTKSRNIIIGVCTAVAILFLMMVAGFFYEFRRRKKLKETRETTKSAADSGDDGPSQSSIPDRKERLDRRLMAMFRPISKVNIRSEWILQNPFLSQTPERQGSQQDLSPESILAQLHFQQQQQSLKYNPGSPPPDFGQKPMTPEQERNMLESLLRVQQELIQEQQQQLVTSLPRDMQQQQQHQHQPYQRVHGSYQNFGPQPFDPRQERRMIEAQIREQQQLIQQQQQWIDSSAFGRPQQYPSDAYEHVSYGFNQQQQSSPTPP